MSPDERESLIIGHMPQVRNAAKLVWMRARGRVDFDDLVSVGYVRLVLAADAYDPKRGVKFKTFAEYYIRGAMWDYMRSLDWAHREDRAKIKAGLAQERQLLSLSTAQVEASLIGVPDGSLREVEMRVSLSQLRAHISERENATVGYLLQDLTCVEIGARTNTSPVYVSQIGQRAIRRMRAAAARA